MKKPNYLWLLFAGLIAISGCKKDKSPAVPSTTAELRIFNATPWTFYNCTVDPSGTLSDNPGANAFNFGQVEINSMTGYTTFSTLYQYSWIRLTMNNKTYYLKPFDYTGEIPLVSGRYTYKLAYTSANDQLNLELIKD